MNAQQIQAGNARVLSLMSTYLNCFPTAVNGADVRDIAASCNVSPAFAYTQLLAALCGLDTLGADAEFFREWFVPMVHALDPAPFETDAYARTVRADGVRGGWELSRARYAPYEAFVCGDLRTFPNGKIVPCIGFFEREYNYLSVAQDGREWMSVNPNEIATMRAPIARASGRVLTYGLGLGYFSFHAAQKPQVSHLTVVERDPSVIELFRECLLPQFPNADKIEIIRADALEFARSRAAGYDYIFADIWHDPSDGVPLWQALRACEQYAPDARFDYWCEDTMKCYL